MPGEYERSSSKNMGPETKMTSFLKTSATILMEFRKFMQIFSLNKRRSWCFQEHKREMLILWKPALPVGRVLLLFGYSVTNNGLPGKSPFQYQGNAVEVNRILQGLCNVCTDFFASSYIKDYTRNTYRGVEVSVYSFFPIGTRFRRIFSFTSQLPYVHRNGMDVVLKRKIFAVARNRI
jgi:hypothetical protein